MAIKPQQESTFHYNSKKIPEALQQWLSIKTGFLIFNVSSGGGDNGDAATIRRTISFSISQVAVINIQSDFFSHLRLFARKVLEAL